MEITKGEIRCVMEKSGEKVGRKLERGFCGIKRFKIGTQFSTYNRSALFCLFNP